ncbi:hypothetical protein D3C78_1964200 [compost metagenome]
MPTSAPVTDWISARLEASESSARKQLPSGSTIVNTLPETLAAKENARPMGVVPGAVSTTMTS